MRCMPSAARSGGALQRARSVHSAAAAVRHRSGSLADAPAAAAEVHDMPALVPALVWPASSARASASLRGVGRQGSRSYRLAPSPAAAAAAAGVGYLVRRGASLSFGFAVGSLAVRHMTSTSDGGAARIAARRQEWYRRQLAAQTLCSLDVMPLVLRTGQSRGLTSSHEDCSAPDASRCQPAAIADIFLSCCTSSPCEGAALHSIFEQLSAEQQCVVLSQAIAAPARFPRLELEGCIATALHSSAFSLGQWVRLVAGLPRGVKLAQVPWAAVAERVLSSDEVPFPTNDDACAFIEGVLTFMEAQGTPADLIARCMASCGLLYEASAYASLSSPAATFTPPPATMGGLGFGDVMRAMCALPEPPMLWFDEVQRRMPRVLRRYSTLVLLRSVVQRWGVTFNGVDDRWRRVAEAHMTPLEAASAVHFVLREGTSATARILLPQCHTQQQIATLMRFTRDTTVAAAVEALARSAELRTAERSLARVHLTHPTTGQTACLLFCAQAERTDVTVGAADAAAPDAAPLDSRGTTLELFSRTLSLGVLDRAALRRCLREVIPAAALARGDRSLSHLLVSIPASAVGHVVRSLGVVEGDALSWWASLNIAAGNVDGAFAVLEATAARGCLPHMGVLVELLEVLQDDTHNFPRVVALLQSSFSQVTDTVLRAFVERAATGVLRAAPGALSRSHAQRALSTLELLTAGAGAAAAAAADTSGTGVRPLQCAAVARRAAVAIPLHVRAIEGVLAASATLGYDVALTVELETATGECCGSWTAAQQAQTHEHPTAV